METPVPGPAAGPIWERQRAFGCVCLSACLSAPSSHLSTHDSTIFALSEFWPKAPMQLVWQSRLTLLFFLSLTQLNWSRHQNTTAYKMDPHYPPSTKRLGIPDLLDWEAGDQKRARLGLGGELQCDLKSSSFDLLQPNECPDGEIQHVVNLDNWKSAEPPVEIVCFGMVCRISCAYRCKLTLIQFSYRYATPKAYYQMT